MVRTYYLPASSTWTQVLPNKIGFMLIKAVEEEEHWPRLLKDKAFEKTNVKIDWDK